MPTHPLRQILAGVGAVLLLPLATQVSAADDEAISTRTVTGPSTNNASPDSSGTDKSPVVSALAQDQVLSRLSGYAPVERVTNYPFGESEPLAEPVREKPGIRSEIGVSIGTGGYRSGYISSLIPLGENGVLGIAISKTDHGRNSYGYGYPYGYSAYGYEPYLYGDRVPGTGPSTGPGTGIADRSLSMSARSMFPQATDTERCRMRNASDDSRRFNGGYSGCALTD